MKKKARSVPSGHAMKLEIEEFLDKIDEWKFKVHEELKGLNPAQRKAYWARIHEWAPVSRSERR